MRRVILVPRARRDLAEVWNYTAETWSASQADRYLARLVSKINRLARPQPATRRCDDLYPGLWRVKSDSHLIFFLLADNEVQVVRILHEQMDFEQHLGDVAAMAEARDSD